MSASHTRLVVWQCGQTMCNASDEVAMKSPVLLHLGVMFCDSSAGGIDADERKNQRVGGRRGAIGARPAK